MLNIAFESKDYLVANKPSGLLCVPGLSSPDNLFDQVKQYNPNARTVHRLDMSTSGLVIFALNYEAQKKLSKLFEERKIHKTYIAKVFGNIEQNCGEIESRMICDWPVRPKQKIDWLNGKFASTYYQVIPADQIIPTDKQVPVKDQEDEGKHTRVFLHPRTGRTHQLRLHMLQLGHPILGDNLYNINDSNKLAERLLLQAKELSFIDPFTDEARLISIPDDF